MNNLSVTKRNSLIDAQYTLPLQAQKLILACLAKLDPRGEIPEEITITSFEFARLTGIHPRNAHRELQKASEKLYQSDITLYENDEKVELRWIQEKAEKLSGDMAVRLVWSRKILKYISQIKSDFTSYKIRNIAGLQSVHAIRVYELLMRFKSTGQRIISIKDFKIALGISDKYPLFKALNRDVIKLSVDELNQHSDLKVKYETIKNGRSVVSISFEFKRNDQIKMDI